MSDSDKAYDIFRTSRVVSALDIFSFLGHTESIGVTIEVNLLTLR